MRFNCGSLCCRLSFVFGVLSAVFGTSATVSAAPQITNMSVRGLQVGGATTITIQGTELLPQPRLMIGVPVEKQLVLENATANQIQIQVTLAADVTPGLYNLRLANPLGISGGVIVAVDKLSQVTLGERTESMPVALHGTLAGSSIVRTKLAGKAGQPLLIEAEAKRLGGKLRPVIHLYDVAGRQVAWAMPVPWLGGDARIVTTLPADGEYSLELHDLQYAAQAPSHFRLKVGTWQFADQVFPPAIERGKATRVQPIGNAPADKFAEVMSSDVTRPIPVPWSDGEAPSGWRPKIIVSDIPEFVETPTSGTPQLLPGIPAAVSGRLDARAQEDVYRLAVTEGTKLRFDVVADRIGSPVDAVLEIRNEQGGRIALNDDFSATTDSRIDYTVPKDVKTLDIAVRDQSDRGDLRCIYRLVITPLEGPSRRPSFRLTLSDDTHNVPQGATKTFQVVAERDGYDGPIRLSFDNLPARITAHGTGIPAGSNGTLITLDATGEPAAGIVTAIRGTSVGMDPPVVALAAFVQHPLGNLQPWMQNDLAFSLAPPNSVPFRIDWNPSAIETQLWLGSTLKAPIKLVRPAGAIGPVRLTFVASEPVPVVNGIPDVNSVRAERPTVDVPIDPPAKAAMDALAVADKTVSETQAKIKTTMDAGTQAVAQAQGTAKAVADKRAAITKVAADATARQVAATTKLKEVMAELAAADKSLADANSQLTTVTAELVTAEKALADMTAKAKADIDAVTAALQQAQAKQSEADKALRDAEAKIKNDLDFNILVPPSLSQSSHDLAIKAELRSVDNQRVLAEVYTPVRRLAPVNPLALKLPGDPAFVAKLDAQTGASVKITGTVERKGGFAGDVTVSVAGQPAGVPVPTVVVKPDKNDFELELKFPANFAAAQIETIKLVATGPPNPQVANMVVRAEIPLVVNILPAEPAAIKE